MKNYLNEKTILFVLPSLNLGGSERQAIHLAQYLTQKQNAHVRLLGFGVPGRVSQLCNDYGLPWDALEYIWPFSRVGRVRASIQFGLSLRQYKPDILLPYGFTTVICGLSYRFSGAKLCVWNQRNDGTYLQGTKLERLSVRLTPRFISNSEHGVAFLMNHLNVEPDKTAVVYNGVELASPIESRHSWRTRLKISEGDFVAGMIANLRHPKDHVTLLKAWRQVVDCLFRRGITATLLLAGRFDETHEVLKALAFDLELGRNVRFLGKVDDIAGLLSAIDLGVFSSLKEGCPNGVLECMAAGLAVVGTDIPGIREAVGESSHSWLAPPKDVDTLATRLVRLAENDALRNYIGKLNQQRIKTQFTYEQMGQATASLLSNWLV